MSSALGIDLGGKAVGVAVVSQPENRVLWCGTVHLSDKIKCAVPGTAFFWERRVRPCPEARRR